MYFFKKKFKILSKQKIPSLEPRVSHLSQKIRAQNV